MIKISDQFQSLVDSKFKEIENGKAENKLVKKQKSFVKNERKNIIQKNQSEKCIIPENSFKIKKEINRISLDISKSLNHVKEKESILKESDNEDLNRN